jgi:hypothetical protein
MDAEVLEVWLKKKPKPKAIRLTVNGETLPIIKLQPGQTWLPIAESLVAKGPELIEALDADECFIRAITDDQLDERAASSPARVTPVRVQLPTPTDPESARFVLVAQLLAEAYRHSNDVAFQAMVDLFEASNRRAETTERTVDHLSKLLRKAAEQQLKDGEPGESTGEPNDILKALAVSLLNPPTNHATNGKAKES